MVDGVGGCAKPCGVGSWVCSWDGSASLGAQLVVGGGSALWWCGEGGAVCEKLVVVGSASGVPAGCRVPGAGLRCEPVPGCAMWGVCSASGVRCVDGERERC